MLAVNVNATLLLVFKLNPDMTGFVNTIFRPYLDDAPNTSDWKATELKSTATPDMLICANVLRVPLELGYTEFVVPELVGTFAATELELFKLLVADPVFGGVEAGTVILKLVNSLFCAVRAPIMPKISVTAICFPSSCFAISIFALTRRRVFMVVKSNWLSFFVRV